MAHEPHHIDQAQYAPVGKFKHHGQRVGQYRHPGGGRPASALLLGEQMWRMVRVDHVNASVGQRLVQRVAVSCALYRGIALYERTFGSVVRIGEPEMCRAGLGSELLVLQRFIAEKLQFACGGNMQDVQVHIGTCRHIHCL